MNKTIMVVGVVVIVVLGGAAAWYFTQNNSQSTEDTANSSQTNSGEAGAAVFRPQPMDAVSYVATFKVTGKDGASGTGLYEHASNGDYKMSGSSQGQAYEAYFVGGAMISCSDGECIKMPGNMSNAPVDADSIGFNESEADSDGQVKYVGTESCSAGTCDKWEVTDLSKNGKVTYYTQNDRMYRMIAESDDGTMDGTYEYKDVTIVAPANVMSL